MKINKSMRTKIKKLRGITDYLWTWLKSHRTYFFLWGLWSQSHRKPAHIITSCADLHQTFQKQWIFQLPNLDQQVFKKTIKMQITSEWVSPNTRDYHPGTAAPRGERSMPGYGLLVLSSLSPMPLSARLPFSLNVLMQSRNPDCMISGINETVLYWWLTWCYVLLLSCTCREV